MKLKAILDKLTTPTDDKDFSTLVQLVGYVRPGFLKKKSTTGSRLAEITNTLRQQETIRLALRKIIDNLLAGTDSLSLYTQAGNLASEGFFPELFRKIAHSILPPAPSKFELRSNFNILFHRKNDFEWIAAIPNEELREFLNVLYPEDSSTAHLTSKLLHAIEVLSHRITGIGLSPALINRHPTLNKRDSPFLVLHQKVIERIYDGDNAPLTKIQYEEIIHYINWCEEVLQKIRTNQHKMGANLNLTHLLHSVYNLLQRLRTLITIHYEQPGKNGWNTVISFFKYLVKVENRRYSVIDHLNTSVGYLAYEITEHAGKTGDKYITNSAKEYRKMAFSAMGGGFIVAFLSCFKTLIYYLRLAPAGEAFLYSMNYSLGFIGIHITHSTLATKQPAMTASRIASSLDNANTENEAMQNLSRLIVKTFRSQFIAFVGNILVAFPVAYGLSKLFYQWQGRNIATEGKALSLITELHPWKSFSLLHAAIAGVCLFLAGVISGYYDNAIVYRKIPDRLRHHRFLKTVLPGPVLNWFCRYIDNNLGSLTGNFFLGIFLGCMGTLGFILGLPIDIRHVTFASGNFGLALAELGGSLPLRTMLVTVAGIIGIGLVNFLVSFGLSLFVAIKSRNVAFDKTGLLISLLFRHFFKRPFDFFFPPNESVSKAPRQQERVEEEA